jgi:peptidoglycan/LPS O-acetylase OafA/YrhL
MDSKVDRAIDIAEVGQSTRSAVKRPPSLPALTGLRFFAALVVLLFHFGAGFAERGGIPTPVVHLLQNGYLGVSLFFVLSGFILTYTHQWDILDRRFLADFYVARFARIYPVYLLALLAALPVLAHPLSMPGVVAVLTMTQAWTPPLSSSGFLWVMQAWTLSVELAFYLFFPAVLLSAKQLNAAATALVAAAAAALIVIFGLSSIWPGTSSIPHLSPSTVLPIPLLRSAEFIYGVMLCRLTVLCPHLSKAIGGHLFELLMIAAVVAIMCVASNVQSKALFTVAIGVLIVQLAGGYGVITAALSSKALLLLGGASYALYLLQGPARAICEQYVPHPFDRFVSPVATIAGAILVFLFWEQPCRRLLLSSYRRSLAKY